MKILFYLLHGHGGGYSNLKHLLETMIKEYPNDRFHIVCAEGQATCELGKYSNVKVLPQVIKRGKEFQRLYLGLWGLRQIVRSVQADVVWSVNMGPYRDLGVPHIMTMNNPYQVVPMQYLEGLHPKGDLYVKIMRLFFRRSLKFTSTVITQTEMIKTYLEQSYRFQGGIIVIPKAVESDGAYHFKPLLEDQQVLFEGKLGNAAFTFLYVAAYYPHKNFKVVIDAIKILRSNDHKVRLALTLHRNDIVKAFGEEAGQMVDEGSILPLGWVNKDQLKTIYDKCDACVMPSKLEAQSSAHLEAMKWERPQITVDLPYARDLCKDAALYAESTNVDQWAEKMLQIMYDPQTRDSLIKQGLKVMKRFPVSWDEMAHRYHEAFEKTIKTKGAGR